MTALPEGASVALGNENERTTRGPRCGVCAASNDADARFCEECGNALPTPCPSCGGEVKAQAKFCKHCGHDISTEVPMRQDVAKLEVAVRKTVTVLFADLAGSTAFEERVDAETTRSVMARFHELLQHTADTFEAGVVKFIGDGFMAVWGVPVIGENDALRSVEAGVSIQGRFEAFSAEVSARHGVELALRVSINTGEVVVGDDDADLVGDALNVAARLEKECPPGSVVVGEPTWRATRDRYGYREIGEVVIRGREAPVSVYELGDPLAIVDDADAIRFVGRDAERHRLAALWQSTSTDPSIRMATVIGPPGVGKTRLAREVARELDAASVEITCSPDANDALGPVGDAIRVLAGAGTGDPVDVAVLVAEGVADRDRLVGVLDNLATGGTRHSVEETFWAVRRLVEIAAADRPLLIVVDDIQWADPVLLDLLEHLAEWARDAPSMVISLARPEIREVRNSFAEPGRLIAEVIILEGLGAEATAQLANNLLGSGRIPSELVERLPASTEGNPLFVRELVRMLVHDGVLARQGDDWQLTIDADAIDVPPSIHALLATRLERLPAADRRVLEVASVIGSEFSLGAVAELLGPDRADTATTALDRLRRLQMAEPAGVYLGNDPVWRFHHALIRDVAYRRLLKADRADLHERFARWFDSTSAQLDRDESVARHLDAARGYRLDLDQSDAHTASLSREAADRYLAAARRALERDELTAAGVLASLGVAIESDTAGTNGALIRLACEALLSANDVGAAAPMVERFASIADPDAEPWVTCYRGQLAVLTDPDSLLEAEAHLTAAIDEFERRDDHAGSAKAHLVRASARARLGRIADAEEDLDGALVAAREADDRRLVTSVLGSSPAAALWGPSAVPRAGGRCLDVIRLQRITTASPSVEATSVRCQAVLEALRGRAENARSMLGRARDTVSDLGLRHGLMETELFAGMVEMIDGDALAAEPHFRAALEGLGQLRVGADAGQAAALLARSLLAQGRLDEADEHASTSEKLAGHNLKTAIAWRTVRAELLSAHGHHDDAVVLAQEAVDIAAPTDLLLDHADAQAALARMHEAAGNEDAAGRARLAAHELYEQKGALALVDRTERDPRIEPTADGSGDLSGSSAASSASTLPIENDATRAIDVWARWYNTAGDDEEFFSFTAGDVTSEDRRRTVSGTGYGSLTEVLTAHRGFQRLVPTLRHRALAVRGDHLMLWEYVFSDDGGNEIPFVGVLKTNAEGKIQWFVSFDIDDQDAARDLLDEHYVEQLGPAYQRNGTACTQAMRIYRQRDLDAYRSLVHPDFFVEGHGSVLFGRMDIDEYVDYMTDGFRLVERDHCEFTLCRWRSSSVVVVRIAEKVTVAGLDNEWAWIAVLRFDAGRIAEQHTFEAEDVDAAIALAESFVAAGSSSMENTATRLFDDYIRWYSSRGTDDEFKTIISPSAQGFDRRTTVSNRDQIGHDELLSGHRAIQEVLPNIRATIIGVRGDRVGLFSVTLSDENDFEVPTNIVIETDDAGRLQHYFMFDPEDVAAAEEMLEERARVALSDP